MGIDLKVMVSSFRERGGELVTTATLQFERDAELFSKLFLDSVPCLARPLPAGLKIGCYEDQGLVFKQADGYQKPLTFMTSADFSRLDNLDHSAAWNEAILAFLNALPEDVRIVLYWH